MAYAEQVAKVDATITTMKQDTVAPYVKKTDLEAFWNELAAMLDWMEAWIIDCCGPY